jgi:hypothetical protein
MLRGQHDEQGGGMLGQRAVVALAWETLSLDVSRQFISIQTI